MKENTVDNTVKNRIIIATIVLGIVGSFIYGAYEWSKVSSDENQKMLSICLEGISKIASNGIDNQIIEHEIANMLQNKCLIP